MAIRMYLLFMNRSASLIGSTKSSPHFINGSFCKIVTSLSKLYVAKPLALGHASQDLQNSKNHEIVQATNILHQEYSLQ